MLRESEGGKPIRNANGEKFFIIGSCHIRLVTAKDKASAIDKFQQRLGAQYIMVAAPAEQHSGIISIIKPRSIK